MKKIRCEISTRWDHFTASAAALRGSYFDSDKPIYPARAPGRLDVMGGIADYSGSAVLEMPLECAAYCAVQAAKDNRLVARSANAESHGYEFEVSVNSSESVRALRDRTDARWATYVLGSAAILQEEGHLHEPKPGFRFYVESDVPLGAGVSSSAALEVASMLALAELVGLNLDGVTLARLCQRVENEIAGAPCGIMDQMTSALGEENRLLALDCRPHTVMRHVAVPPEWSFVALDSGVKHSVAGGSYQKARVSAFMGLRILEVDLGCDLGGYLCNMGSDEWTRLRESVPETMDGDEFLSRYGHLPDSVTTVDPLREYFPRSASEHPILENERVRRFIELLRNPVPATAHEAGQLMLQSHHSYSDRVRLGSEETDLLVRLAMEQGPERGIYGAKITGGGSGGAVALLCSGPSSDSAIEFVRREYAAHTGISPAIIAGSSPGALAFGAHPL